LLILSIILCGISFFIPTAEVVNIDSSVKVIYFLWGGQFIRKDTTSTYPPLFLYPSMVGFYRQVARPFTAGGSFSAGANYDYMNTLIIGYVFLTLTLLLFVLSLIFGIKGLFHMYRGDIKKELSWIFSSGVTAILAIIIYFVIMSFLILPSWNITLSGTGIPTKIYENHESWGVGFYLFLFGGLMLTMIGSRKYIKQINEELKKEIPEDTSIKKPKK